MAERWPDAALQARLQALWRAEFARAEADFPALIRTRPATRMQLALPTGLVGLLVAALALAVLARPFGGAPAGGGIQLGSDGLPVAIDGQTVLRLTQVAGYLAEGPAASFLVGGRLTIAYQSCPVSSTATQVPGSIPCGVHWRLVDTRDGSVWFYLAQAQTAPGFVPTSGALTVFRVNGASAATDCGAGCPLTLLVEEVVWRQPTKGPIPSDAMSSGGSIDDLLVPDFVSAYGQDGMTIVGYIPKRYLLTRDTYTPGTPENPPEACPLPVYASDLKTLVGYHVPGQGYMPLGAPGLPSPCG